MTTPRRLGYMALAEVGSSQASDKKGKRAVLLKDDLRKPLSYPQSYTDENFICTTPPSTLEISEAFLEPITAIPFQCSECTLSGKISA